MEKWRRKKHARLFIDACHEDGSPFNETTVIVEGERERELYSVL